MDHLVDTCTLIFFLEDSPRLPDGVARRIEDPGSRSLVSLASLWEIAIKSRLGKLRLDAPLQQLPDLLRKMDCTLLTIDEQHVLAELNPEPQTRDPFDRLLLAQCQVENLRLVTNDRALATHPLVWR